MEPEELTATREAGADESADDSASSRVRGRVARVFSAKAFVVALVASFAAVFLAGSVPVIGGLTGLLGLVAVAFAAGLVGGRRRYAELAAAGAVAAGANVLLDNLVLSLAVVGLPLVAVGAAAGVAAAVVGHYLGRDLRAGATADL
jgi:hypothetical protein